MHLHNIKSLINRLNCKGCLLAGGNWNNAGNAGPSYLNSNNTLSNVNANIGTHLELKIAMSSPEHQFNQNQIYPSGQTPIRLFGSASIAIEHSSKLAGLDHDSAC